MSDTEDFGGSDELKSIFEGLKQTEFRARQTSVSSSYKYRDKDIDTIKKLIVCRNYKDQCHELSYLLWAVVNSYPNKQSKDSLFNFFYWDEITTEQRFKQAFSKPWTDNAGKVELTEKVLHIEVGNIHFDISPSRIGVLSVLVEFIATVDHSLLTQAQTCLFSASDNERKAFSNTIQRGIYKFIKDGNHLPTVQHQTRYQQTMSWLSVNNLSLDQVNDGHIIRFWQDSNQNAAESTNASCVKFEQAICDVIDTLDVNYATQAQRQVEWASSISTGDDIDEIDLDRYSSEVSESLFDACENTIDIDQLRKNPKCITNDKQATIAKALTRFSSPVTSRFFLTIMRLHVFGYWQNQLIQQQQTRKGQSADILNTPPQLNYIDYEQELLDCSNAFELSSKALLHIIYQHNAVFVLPEFIKRLNSHNSALKQWLYAALDGDFTHVKTQQAIKEAQLQWRDLGTLLSDFRKAFNNNDRQGFKTLPSTEFECYLHQGAYEALTKIMDQLAITQKKHADFAQKHDLNEIFASDLSIFTSMFTYLYGDVHADE